MPAEGAPASQTAMGSGGAAPEQTMSEAEPIFARAQAIADAVLWEGYLLYPYRRSAAKNRIRFQWGVVGPAEETSMTATALVDRSVCSAVHVRMRFLRLRRRDDGWDEADVVERDVEVPLDVGERTIPIKVDGGNGAEPLSGAMQLTVVDDDGAARVTVRIDNPGDATVGRDAAMLRSFVGCHVLFAAAGDAFVSLLEPPEWATGAAARCEQHRCWPVLVGPEPARDLVLASPVILYDYPVISPKSPGDFFDGTEIDEMLTLRVQTMTDEEKDEARRTDPKAAAIIDRCEAMPDDVMASLHGMGATGPPVDPNPEWSDPGPGEVLVGGTVVARGTKVELRPRRRADAHDLFLAGRTATVAEVVYDVDGDVHIAVTIDDDPGAELWEWQRRYLYFAPDEVEPVGERVAATAASTEVLAPATRVLVAGVGNIFRSDDGFGSAVISELLQQQAPDGARIVDYGIGGVHLAFDLADGVETLILVDTVPDAGGGPGSVAVIEVEPGSFGRDGFDAHDLDPGAMFRSLGSITDRLPRTLVVGCQPATLDDGIGLSEPVAAAVPIAAVKVLQLLRQQLGGPG